MTDTATTFNARHLNYRSLKRDAVAALRKAVSFVDTARPFDGDDNTFNRLFTQWGYAKNDLARLDAKPRSVSKEDAIIRYGFLVEAIKGFTVARDKAAKANARDLAAENAELRAEVARLTAIVDVADWDEDDVATAVVVTRVVAVVEEEKPWDRRDREQDEAFAAIVAAGAEKIDDGARFGLRAFPGEVFVASRFRAFHSSGTVQIVVHAEASGLDLTRGTSSELAREIVAIVATKRAS